MLKINAFIIIMAFTAISASDGLASTYWVDNGIVVCDAPSKQEDIVAAADGFGGAVIAWRDQRAGAPYNAVYAQRVNQRGETQWPEDGVELETDTPVIAGIRLIPDGGRGAFFTYKLGQTIHIGRLSASGVVLWLTSESTVLTTAGFPDIAPDSAGGCFVTWNDDRNGQHDIFAQRFDADGNRQMASGGQGVCTALHDQKDPRITPVGTAAVIVWRDFRGGGPSLYAQKIDGAGLAQWTNFFGMSVCTAAGTKNSHQIVTVIKGLPSYLIAWVDDRNGNPDIFAQLLDWNGGTTWAAAGVPVCTNTSVQDLPQLLPSSSGGGVIVWQDARGGPTDRNIYGQYVDDKGLSKWAANGRAICSASGDQRNPRIIGAQNDAIVVWDDSRSGSKDIYAQKIDTNGDPLWTLDGVAITDLGQQTLPAIVSDGEDGAIVAWTDERPYPANDVRAQRVLQDGTPVDPRASIEAVLDIPDDEGGYARIKLGASNRDLAGISFPRVTLYNVWRKIEALFAFLPAEHEPVADSRRAGLLSLASDPQRDKKITLSTAEAVALGLPPGTWESIGLHVAMQQAVYYFTVPTRQDSSQSGTHWETFVVSAHTSDPELYFVSFADSGYSVDNIAPVPPGGLAAVQGYQPVGLSITWDANVENDLWHYAVYRGTEEGFVPGPGNRVATPTDSEWFDDEWRWYTDHYYKVSALDVHGNESDWALLRSGDVTGATSPAPPGRSYLAQNVPNPFNPGTKIEFGLQRPSRFSLVVYDAAGRLVRIISQGNRPAGRYAETWDGNDESGRAVATGVYFCRLEAGTFTKTMKMVLLR